LKTGKDIPRNIEVNLDKTGTIPAGMVRVKEQGAIPDFFIDKLEVTNKQFKEFMDREGYQKKEYWKHKFIKEGKELSWEEAMAEFVDQTGRPGPATWRVGDNPNGQDDYPVAGISWYETAAYAEFSGKNLPTVTHCRIAAQGSSFSSLAQLSNFGGDGTVPVGSLKGMTSYGVYDIAGNVREWCWNEEKKGRINRGRAWNDATYMAGNISQASSFDRSPKNVSFQLNSDKLSAIEKDLKLNRSENR